MRLEVPGSGLERGASERVAANALAEERVHGLGAFDLPTHEPWDEDLLEHQAG